MKKPACLRCIHYFSTFDPARPRGCKLYSMKTQGFPSMVVRKETGMDCQGFKEKIQKKDKNELNLRDPNLW